MNEHLYIFISHIYRWGGWMILVYIYPYIFHIYRIYIDDYIHICDYLYVNTYVLEAEKGGDWEIRCDIITPRQIAHTHGWHSRV